LSEIGVISGHPQYFNLGDPKVAAVWLQKAVDGFEQLMAGDAYDFEARLALSSANGDLAAVIGESDPTRGEQLYRRSLALGVPLLQSHPLDTTSRDTQAIHRVGFARVLRRLGKRGEALAELQKAVKILEGLCEQSPENIEFRRDLAEALDDLAAQRLEENDDDGAERALQRSLGLLEPIYRENPRDLFALRDLAGCYEGFGDLAASRSDWRQARLQYQKSLDLWEHWKEVGVSSVYDRQRRDLAARLVERAARKTSRNPPSR
jgi:serine/threonine-protein kinase